VSAQNDSAFLRMFLFILGGLVAFAVVILLVADQVGGDANSDDSLLQAAVAERIAPVASVAIATASQVGDAAPVADEADAADTAPTGPAAAGAASDGRSIYADACSVCHDSGLAGAPKPGDATAWAERLAAGVDSLNRNALNGKGAMPPKGGRADLSDDDVRAAVAWLVEQVR